jgi:hypothetical protein
MVSPWPHYGILCLQTGGRISTCGWIWFIFVFVWSFFNNNITWQYIAIRIVIRNKLAFAVSWHPYLRPILETFQITIASIKSIIILQYYIHTSITCIHSSTKIQIIITIIRFILLTNEKRLYPTIPQLPGILQFSDRPDQNKQLQ